MDKYFLCNQLEEGISIDSLIQNGDTSAILVSGRRELLQRVWIQLTAHRGEFPYCGTLGSRLYQIAASDSKCEQKVLEAIEEALEFIPQVRVKDVVIAEKTITVYIETEYGDDALQFSLKGASCIL